MVDLTFDEFLPAQPKADQGPQDLSFDEFLPAPAPVRQTFQPPMATHAGQVLMDDGQARAPMSSLVAQYADRPEVQAAMGIKRGTLAGEAAAFGPMMNQAFHQTLIPSMIDYQNSGAADRADAETANWRGGMLDGGLEQLDPRQKQMALLDPTLAAQQMGDQPGRPLTNPAEQRQLAQQSNAAAIPKEAAFAQNQGLDRAVADAIPSYDTAESTLGKVFAGAGSATANVLGSLPAVENLVPAERGATLLQTAKNAFLPNAAAGFIADPVVQANQVGAGLQDKYSAEQTAAAGVVGGVAGSALAAGFQVPSALRGWIEQRAGKRVADMAPNEAEHWLQQAQAVSDAAGRSSADPEFQAQMVQQNTGLDAARSTDPAAVAAQRATNKARGSELAETFNDVNIWPRDQVNVGPEGIDIPEGTTPVRDAAGEQARVETLAPRGQAADMARQLGIENPSARDLDTIVTYMQNGLSPRGAVNAFRRAATQGDRAGMTPDLARTAGEKANSQQFAKEAFDIADIRRQRREAELDRWEPDLQADYSAGAPRADEITPRMAQDLAARSQEPAPGTSTVHPEPRRSVDVIGSKSVGGLRGEYLPGERPAGPEAPQEGRTGDMFEAERVEPRLDGPPEAPVREQPAEAPVEAGAVEPVAPDNVTPLRADVPEWRRKPKGPPTKDKDSIFRYEQWEDQQYLDASPDVKAQADDLEARADAEYSQYHKKSHGGQEGYNKPNPTPDQWMAAKKHYLEWSRLRQERSRLLRGSDDLMNPIARDNHAALEEKTRKHEEMLIESRRPRVTPKPGKTTRESLAAVRSLLQNDKTLSPADKAELRAAQKRLVEALEKESATAPGRENAPQFTDPSDTGVRVSGRSKSGRQSLLEQRAANSDVLARDPKAKALADQHYAEDLDPATGQPRPGTDAAWVADNAERLREERAGLPDDESLARGADEADRESPAPPTPEAAASPKADKAPGDAAKLRQLEHELSLSRYFDDSPEDIAKLEKDIADLKGGNAPAEKPAPTEEPATAGRLDRATADALTKRVTERKPIELGGSLLRNAEGKVYARTKHLDTDPPIHRLMVDYRYSATEAANILDRAATGKGRALTAKQQEFVKDLVKAHKGPSEGVGDDFDLNTHTESDLTAREQETQQAQAKQASERKTAENKAQADKDRDDFTLSGSDRPADVAASRGQSTLFDFTGAAVHGGKQALGAVGKGIKAVADAVWKGDDNRTAREHARDLAEPIAQLMERKGPTVEGRTKAGLRKFFDSAEASLRSLAGKTDSPTLKQLADVFHSTAGKGDGVAPTLDERSQTALFGGKKGYMNRAEDIHNFMHDNDLNNPKSTDQIVKLVENPGTPRTGKVGEAANMITDFFKDAHKYLKDAGIDMGEVRGYFPREHDVSLVESKRTAFVDAAAKAYKQDNPGLSPTDARAKAEEYWSAVVHGRDVPPGGGTGASSSPKPDFMKGRIFSKDAAKHLEPFYSRNVGGMLSNYALRAVRRAEVAKSGVEIDGKFQPFGDNFKNWDTITKQAMKEDPRAREVMDQINQLTSVNAGIPTSNYGRTAENAMSWVRTAGTLGMLEKSALASVGELATGPLRGTVGNAGDIANVAKNLGGHAVNTLRAVVGKKGRSKAVKEMFDFSDEIGATTESQQGSTAAARFEGNEPGSKLQSQLLTSFFKRNMLTPLTEYTRATTANQARIFMQRLAKEAPSAKRDVLLRELGVKKGQEQAFADYVSQFGKALPGAAELKGPQGDLYKNAALRFTDQAVQRPNSSTKPAWASHPLGKMIFQFQSFNYAFQKNVLNRMVRLAVMNKEMSAGEKAKLGASMGLSVGAMTGIQAMVTEVREKLYSRPDQKELTPGAKAEGTISRSGLLGVADPWVQMVNGGVRYGRDPSQSLLGPSLGQASGTLGSFLGPNAEGTNTAERRRARMLYQTFGEPLAQAALSATPAGPISKALTTYVVPKAGEWATDAIYPDNKKRTASDEKPIKGMVESLADVFNDEAEEPSKRPQRPVRGERPKRPTR